MNVFERISDFLNRIWLELALNFGLIRDDPNEAGFKVIGVTFNPPKSSTLMVGEVIEATVTYESNLKGKPIQIWVYPARDGFGGTYEASCLESASGKVSRCFQVSSTGHLDQVEVYIKHYSGELMLSHIKEVDFTIVENPEREALRDDGLGSQINVSQVKYDDFVLSKNGKIPIGDSIEVIIEYQNTASQPVSLWATPFSTGDIDCRYSSGELPQKNSGSVSKYFEVNEPTTIDGIYVVMTNVVDETIAEQWIDFPITFY